MLSSDRYLGTSYSDTPPANAIDPGDLPPSLSSSNQHGEQILLHQPLTNGGAQKSSKSLSSLPVEQSPSNGGGSASFVVGRTQNLLGNGRRSSSSSFKDSRRPHQQQQKQQQAEKSGSLRIMDDGRDLEMTVVSSTSPSSQRRFVQQQEQQEQQYRNDDPYDPYDDRPNSIQQQQQQQQQQRGGILTNDGNSLPSVEEAKNYASSLLMNTEKLNGSGNHHQHNYNHSNQTLPLVASTLRRDRSNVIMFSTENRSSSTNGSGGHRHVLRKQICRSSGRNCFGITCLCFLLFGIALLFIGKASNNHHDNHNSDILIVQPDDSDDDDDDVDEISQRHAEIVDLLIDHDISSTDSLMVTTDNGTPQYSAVQWMADTDVLQYPVPDIPPMDAMNNGDDTISTKDLLAYDRFIQRYVLAVLYFSTHGEAWSETLNFVSALDECSWYQNKQFTDFIREEYIVGVSCDMNLRINAIFIPENNLHGSIPTEIGQLTSVEMISFSGNRILGSIPNTLEHLQHLLYFDVRYNEMTGDIPNLIPNNWKRLEVLELSNNYFVGSIPTDLGIELTNLHTLAVDDNIMTGTLDALYEATSLEYLYCDRNLFNGIVNSTTFMSKLYQIRELDISSNDLSSINTFPAMHLFNPSMHPFLRVLDMANNNFKGKMIQEHHDDDNDDNNNTTASKTTTTSTTTVIPSNNGLQFLSIHGNAISGTIPESISNLHALTHLDIQDNMFTGTIPNNLGLLHELTYLFVGYNPYTGHIDSLPPFVVQMSKLRELSIAGANIYGHLYDAYIDSLTEIRLLDLSENKITGTIPSTLWNLPNLQWLFLDHNNLNEQIPNLNDILSIDNNGQQQSSSQGNGNGKHKIEVVTLHHNINITGNADSICQTADGGINQITLLAMDCNTALQCDTNTCCPSCCQPNEEPSCFDDEIARYMTSIEGTWEYNYTRSTHSYDPDLLLTSSNHINDPNKTQTQQNQYNDTIEEDIQQPPTGYFQDQPNNAYVPHPPPANTNTTTITGNNNN